MGKNESIQFIQNFGKRVKVIRKLKNITQAQLAADANIEISQVSRIERGLINTSIGTAHTLANAMEVHVSELFVEL